MNDWRSTIPGLGRAAAVPLVGARRPAREAMAIKDATRRRAGEPPSAAHRQGVAGADRPERMAMDQLGRRAAPAPLVKHRADGAHDPNVPRAAAKIAAQLKAHAALIGVRKAGDNVACCHEHARGAIPALYAVLAGEGRTQLARHLIVIQSLDRRDLGALTGDRVGDAGAGRRAVDQECAGAAHAVLATQVRSGEELALAQEVGEMGARLGGSGNHPAIHCETDGPHGRPARWTARSRAIRWI